MKLPLSSISRRIALSFGLVASLATQSTMLAQVANPILESISDGIVTLELQDYSRVPQSFGGGKGWARINHLKPDGMGRLFVNDLRGRMYLIGEGSADVYLDLKSEVGSNFDDSRGLGGGFTSFAFHPEFASNGKLYTAHSESVNGTADFTLFTGSVVAHGVVIEWTFDDPSSSTFSGTRTEIMRVEMAGTIHTMQELSFNTAASSSSSDYGNLYICIGDSGTTIAGFPENTSRLDSVLGTILRIDPLGTNSGNGKYGVPSDNPFASDGDDNTFGEIWTYGHRNPHRISWDANDETKMFSGEIGERTMEEVNLIEPGRHYGWNVREGNYLINFDFSNNPDAGENDEVFPLPANDAELGYTYPVGIYDRDEGRTLIGGYVYRGAAFPEFQGQYIFGDLFTGFFSFNADTVVQNTPSTISRVYISYNGSRYASMKDITNNNEGVGNRDPDFRFGYDEDNELFIISKFTGRIYKVAGAEVVDPIDPTLVNISTRGDVGEGKDSLIGGFVIGGTEGMTVLIQGVGDELSSIDSSLDGQTLSDVKITLYDILGNVIAENDDWEDDDSSLKSSAMSATGSTRLTAGSNSSSILRDLEPGQYTVILSGLNADQGIALVEVYEVDQEALQEQIDSGDILNEDNPNLVGKWSFDSFTDTTVADSSSNGNDGTRTGGTTVSGISGDAMSFNGTSDTISIPAAAFSSVSSEVSISMWVYGINQPRADTAFRAEASGDRAMNIHLPWESNDASSGTVYWDCGHNGTGSGGYDRLSDSASRSQFADQWNHWVFTKNATTGDQKIYHNGTLFASATGMTRTMDGVSTAAIGSSGSADYYEGYIDEVLVFDKELNASEISVIYNSQ